MPFPYGLQRVTLDDPLVDDDLTHLDALDHLQDGGGLRGGVDALDGVLDLGGGEHLRGVPQKVRDGLDKGRVLGGTLLSGLRVAACALLVHLLDGGRGELTQFSREVLVGGDSVVEFLSSHSFLFPFLRWSQPFVFSKDFRLSLSKFIIPQVWQFVKGFFGFFLKIFLGSWVNLQTTCPTLEPLGTCLVPWNNYSIAQGGVEVNSF